MHSESLSTDSSKVFTAPNNLNLPRLLVFPRLRCAEPWNFSNQLLKPLVAVRGALIKQLYVLKNITDAWIWYWFFELYILIIACLWNHSFVIDYSWSQSNHKIKENFGPKSSAKSQVPLSWWRHLWMAPSVFKLLIERLNRNIWPKLLIVAE